MGEDGRGMYVDGPSLDAMLVGIVVQYGPIPEEAILSLIKSWGWDDVVANLGKERLEIMTKCQDSIQRERTPSGRMLYSMLGTM